MMFILRISLRLMLRIGTFHLAGSNDIITSVWSKSQAPGANKPKIEKNVNAVPTSEKIITRK